MSHHRSTHSIHNLVSPAEKPNQLLYGHIMTNDRSYQTARPSRKSLSEQAEMIAFWNQEFEHVNHLEADQHEGDHDDRLSHNEILESFIPHEEPNRAPIGDYLSRSEMKNVMEKNIKTSIGIAPRTIVMRIVAETIKDVLSVGYDKQKEGKKTSIRYMVEGGLIDIVEQSRLDTISVHDVGKLAKIHSFIWTFSHNKPKGKSFLLGELLRLAKIMLMKYKKSVLKRH